MFGGALLRRLSHSYHSYSTCGGQLVNVSIVEIVMSVVAWWMQLIGVSINRLLDYHYW
jgi:hypothetical protein